MFTEYQTVPTAGPSLLSSITILMEIIAVGLHCNISELHRLVKINQPTGVFEWLGIPRLAHVVNLIKIRGAGGGFIAKHFDIAAER